MIAILAALSLVSSAPTGPADDPRVSLGVANPAVTQDNIRETICQPGWTKTVRPPVSYTNKLKRRLLPAGANIHDFELDHIWPIEDGGSPTDPNNLRLQKWVGPDGARAKDDEVETPLHRKICSGEITIQQAHATIAAWIVAHRPYEPIPGN